MTGKYRLNRGSFVAAVATRHQILLIQTVGIVRKLICVKRKSLEDPACNVRANRHGQENGVYFKRFLSNPAEEKSSYIGC